LFSETARFYDVIYDEFKDFDAEADQIAELLKRLVPEARTILDVGCGRVDFTTVEREDLKIVRMNTTRVEDGISILDFHYLVGSEGRVQHLEETHELALFTEDEMKEGLASGGLELVEHDPEGLTGRGLYVVGRPQAPTQR
jgi:hypothetical protein